MKLAAIYNVFADSVEFLPHSLNCIKGHVDEVIIVYQTTSNYGETVEEYEFFSENFIENVFTNTVFTYVKYHPNFSFSGSMNERLKRNLGLEVAKSSGCTHFVMMDCDELWEDFGKAKKEFIESGAVGSVARMFTYFKKPTYRFKDYDNYYVPFIFELLPKTEVGNYDLLSCGKKAICDPTRKPNHYFNCHIINEPMHHFSWVREDIMMKVRNSSAKGNIANSRRLEDYNHPECGPGYFVKDFNQELIEVENIFNL